MVAVAARRTAVKMVTARILMEFCFVLGGGGVVFFFSSSSCREVVV